MSGEGWFPFPRASNWARRLSCGALCLVKLKESPGFMHSAWSFCSNSVYISTPPKSRNSFSSFLKAKRRLGSTPRWVAPKSAFDDFWTQGIHWYIKSIKVIFFFFPPQRISFLLFSGWYFMLSKLVTSTPCRYGYGDLKRESCFQCSLFLHRVLCSITLL